MINYANLLKINYNQALKPAEITFMNCKKKERYRRLLFACRDFFYVKFQTDVSSSLRKANYLFIKSMKRPDYDNLFFKIAESCSKPKIIVDTYEKKGKFSLYRLYDFVRFAPMFYKVFRRNIAQWAFLCITLTNLLSQIKSLPRINYRSIVVFADMQPLDNVLVQHSTMTNIESTTMQHGLYVDYESLVNVNVVNYLNTNANNFLAWGQDTAELIKKHHPNKSIYICGKPTISDSNVKKSGNYFTVVFDQNIFFPYNQKMLDVAYMLYEHTALMVNMRLHPNNRLKWFKLKPEITLVEKDIWMSQFVLGHTSSLLYECMRLGIPVFRYNSEIPSVKTPDYIQFESINELVKLIKAVDKIPFNTISRTYINEIGDKSMAEYTKYFNGEKKHYELENKSLTNKNYI